MASPERFFQAVWANHLTAAMKAAIELDVFTAIAEGLHTPEAIGARTQASPRGIRILCDYLTVAQFLQKSADGYVLDPETAPFLDRRSPAYMGGTLRFLLSPTMAASVENMTASVRNGGTVISEHGTMDPDHPVWQDFARAMVPMMALPAEFIAKTTLAGSQEPMQILDLAAGHGLFGIAFARHNPQAEVTALDWRAVLDVAREHAQAAGVTDRYHLMPGSAFDLEFGHGYDVVLITNFLHHFNSATCETLIRKVYGALKPGGRAVTLEFIPNDDRISPPAPATFALAMLASTNEGDAYTFADLDRMFKNAGFERNEMLDVPASPGRIVTSYK